MGCLYDIIYELLQSNEDLKEVAQLSAALVLLHDKATFQEESLFRALNYQLRCKYLLSGMKEALGYLEKFTRRWSNKESPYLRKIILDLEIGNNYVYTQYFRFFQKKVLEVLLYRVLKLRPLSNKTVIFKKVIFLLHRI